MRKICPLIHRVVNVFIFFFKRSFRYENDDENRKTKRSFFKKVCFYNTVVFITIVLIKLVVFLTIVNDYPSLTIVNDDPSLTVVNKEKGREETDLKGIGTYH